jgi:hypothetical protein
MDGNPLRSRTGLTQPRLLALLIALGSPLPPYALWAGCTKDKGGGDSRGDLATHSSLFPCVSPSEAHLHSQAVGVA